MSQQSSPATEAKAFDGVTLARLTLAFQAWEQGFRTRPGSYRSHAECDAMRADEVSRERAYPYIHLQGVAETVFFDL